MIEEQALCRVHRVGQKRSVTTIRYLMRESFEEASILPLTPSPTTCPLVEPTALLLYSIEYFRSRTNDPYLVSKFTGQEKADCFLVKLASRGDSETQEDARGCHF